MDHNLSDALNLDSSMGVDFGHPEDTVVDQTHISLEHGGHDGGIPMEFEHIEEQPMLMDTGSEEIIDFIGEQFTLQEYEDHEDQSNVLTTSIDSSEHSILTSQSDSMIEIEATQHITTTKQDHTLPKMITVKTPFSPPRPNELKRNETEVHTSAPRQVPIAPKPAVMPQASKTFLPGKQFAIAPKPIALLTGKNNSFLKKVTLAGVMQGNTKGNTVLTQIGKQLVMMPTAGPQKLKLLTTGTVMPTVQYIRANTGEQTQLLQTQNVTTHQNKPIITKLLLQGQPNMEVNTSQTLLTNVTPVSSAKSPTHFVTMQQKTVPLTLGNKVLLATPTKSGVKFAKKQQIIAFKSPEKISQASQGPATKKVLITSNPTQNVILKTTAPPKAQITKEGNIIVEGPRTQLHQINVPGKGIQYIRLVTNSNPAPAKPKQQQTINIPAKTFLLTDAKGNLIQMSAEKSSNSGQQPPMVILANAGTQNQMNTTKPQQKLVRIAPLVNKPSHSVVTNRSSQSLLAPISPMSEVPQSANDIAVERQEETDSKAALRALVADALRGEGQSEVHTDMQSIMQPGMHPNMQTDIHLDLQADMQVDTQDPQVSVTEVEVEFKRDFYSDGEENNENTDQHDSSGRSEDHPLIVVPSNFGKETDNMNMSDSQSANDDSQRVNNIIEADMLSVYQSPRTPQALSESDLVTTELGLRPRKACNCTKSQCLKLYCECFANGEFCNRCNCTNCNNNLANEERRHKAIKGCLDRNPNAFRPKIGKAKVGGPETVRRHNKGCNCKRSGCLKNYCECYEAKIACTSICKCVGCRNVEETLERGRRRAPAPASGHTLYRPPPLMPLKQPCSFITPEVIAAVCQCLLAAGGDGAGKDGAEDSDPVRDVIDEFARCLQDIISASHQSTPLALLDDGPS
ncbi:protein lin-54 homolog isoform X2 [Battus philenor]|uniref:protein lin-54 homolog isoform X2 n=1 Tax=Battus philenor TaxID=42288 RepID=UPI0035CF9FFB